MFNLVRRPAGQDQSIPQVKPIRRQGLVTFMKAALPFARGARRARLDRLGFAAIESWPVASDGLLVGVAEPALGGAVPIASSVKTMFIRIDRGELVWLIAPYASLEQEAALCMAALVAEQLKVDAQNVVLDVAINQSLQDVGLDAPQQPLVDLGNEAERSIAACAAVTRLLLMEAAAQVWGVTPADLLLGGDGVVRLAGTRHALRYGEIAALAALMPLPGYVQIAG
jgi:hypothetical protein